MQISSVAMIGVGAMGAPMAMNVHKAGFDLTVCDRSEAALAPFRAEGVTCVAAAADCAACDVVIVIVATPAQADAVLFGEAGLVPALRDGASRPLVVIMGTVSPDWMKETGARLAPHGVRLVDAPVSGGAVRAQEGSLAIIMGGERADCEALRPLMQAMGSAIFHCGPLGSGQATKIVNNLVGISILMTAAEAYRIGLGNGLLLPDAIPVFEAGTGRNFMTGKPHGASEAYSSWTASRETFDSLHAILRKDIDLALAIGGEAGPLPMTEALRGVLERVGDDTFETWAAIAASSNGKA